MKFSTIKIILICFIFISSLTAFAKNTQEQYNNFVIFTKEELSYIKNNPNVKIGMLSNFKPFSFIENNIHQGYTVDLLNKISNISGLRFEIHTGKWKDTLSDFKNKKLNMITAISYVKQREDFTLFTDPYYEIPTYIFGLKNDKNYNTIEDLKNKKVAISYDMYYKEELIKNGIKVIEVPSSNEKAKQLILGNVDYFLASYTSGKKAIISQSITSIKPLDEFRGVKKEDLRFGINKSNLLLHSIIQKSLLAISTHEKTKLTEKWILELKELTSNDISFTQLEKSYLSNNKNLKLCIDPNWMPFEKIDDKGQHIGVTKDYFDIFQKKMKTSINLVKTKSWTQSLEYFENKKCDILSLTMLNNKRIKNMQFSKSYINTPLVLATKMNINFIENISDIQNKKIGIVENYAFFENIKNKYPNLELVVVKNIKEGLNKVSNEELYAFIDALPVIGYELQTNYLGDLKVGAKFDEKLSLNIAVQKDNMILANIFNKLIDHINEEEKKRILNKHIYIQYEKNFDYKLMFQILIVVAFIFAFFIYRQNIQKRNNERLKESYNKIETILDTTLEGLIISRNGIIENANKEAIKLFGFEEKDDLTNKKMIDFVFEEDKKILKEKLSDEFSEPYEISLLKKDNTTFPALVRGKNVKIKNAIYRISSIMDLTAIKEKEAFIIQQSKVATAGEMLENISHQWRQPLSQISTLSTGIKVQKEFGIYNDENLINDMENINHSAQYLSQTIEDFKSFLKPNSENFCEINLKDTIKKVEKLTKDVYNYYNINVIIEDEDCNIIQNENLIIQALLNIANNAKDAIIENRTNIDDESYIFISIKKDNSNALINIKDNGGGIESSILNKIFEPYFTTKHESIGTGIGLYMTYQIIKNQLEGEILVKNEKYAYNGKTHQGASFTIKIPLNN